MSGDADPAGKPDWESDGRDWPNRDASRFVEAGGLTWHVQLMGQGPVLLLLHGTGAATHSWRDLAPLLAERFTVYAPEHPGTTPGAPDDVLHLDGLWDLVLCYDEVLQALGLEGASLAGHSFGGMMACELAAAVPGRAPFIFPSGGLRRLPARRTICAGSWRRAPR